MDDVYEISRIATIIFKVRASSEKEADNLINDLSVAVGTFMVDTTDWRWSEYTSEDQRNAVVEIYAEEV
jgi:hypothetical protein